MAHGISMVYRTAGGRGLELCDMLSFVVSVDHVLHRRAAGSGANGPRCPSSARPSPTRVAVALPGRRGGAARAPTAYRPRIARAEPPNNKGEHG